MVWLIVWRGRCLTVHVTEDRALEHAPPAGLLGAFLSCSLASVGPYADQVTATLATVRAIGHCSTIWELTKTRLWALDYRPLRLSGPRRHVRFFT